MQSASLLQPEAWCLGRRGQERLGILGFVSHLSGHVRLSQESWLEERCPLGKGTKAADGEAFQRGLVFILHALLTLSLWET